MTPELPIVGTGPAAPPAYDVCNPDRLPADRIAFVDAIHQQFLQSFGLALSSYLDMPVKAVPSGIDQLPVSAFFAAGVGDACLITLDIASTRGPAWVGLSAKLLFRVLDIPAGRAASGRTGEPHHRHRNRAACIARILRFAGRIPRRCLGAQWPRSTYEFHPHRRRGAPGGRPRRHCSGFELHYPDTGCGRTLSSGCSGSWRCVSQRSRMSRKPRLR